MMHFSRRSFLKAGAAGLALASMPSLVRAASAKPQVGVQLYSVRGLCGKDLIGTLKAIKEMGYAGVEFAGYYGKSAAELKQILGDTGLVACGTHTGLDSIKPENIAKTIEFNQTIGNKFLIVPWMEGKSKQEWLDKAKFFNEQLVAVKAAGMYLGYHAHAHDFTKFEGTSAWDLFFGTTKKGVVMQLDTSNCRDGGADPVEVLKKYPKRAITIHIKPSGAGPEAAIGEDKVDWKGVFAFCERKGGTQWYIVEHETSKDPMDAVKRNFEALKQMGKV